jgi:hypothetical protein
MGDDTRTSHDRDRFARLEGSEREAFLRERSHLPGPRGNLELLAIAVDLASAEELRQWAALRAVDAPTNTPGEFVATVGAAGLGRLVVEGDGTALSTLRGLAADPRWRVREGVAMALQRIGATDMPALLQIAGAWARTGRYEQRAAVAGIAEPPLLRDPRDVIAALGVLDTVTETVVGASDVRSEGYRALLKALSYAWSVVVAADPGQGEAHMERWLASDDPVVRRIMRANLSKARLERADAAWTAAWRERLGS